MGELREGRAGGVRVRVACACTPLTSIRAPPWRMRGPPVTPFAPRSRRLIDSPARAVHIGSTWGGGGDNQGNGAERCGVVHENHLHRRLTKTRAPLDLVRPLSSAGGGGGRSAPTNISRKPIDVVRSVADGGRGS